MKLYNGDCLELMKEIPDKSVDMILCDLPYGVTSGCRWDSIIPVEPLWKEYKRIVRNNGVAVLFCIQPFTTKLISSNIKDFSYMWYWNKNNKTGTLNAKKQPLRCIEEIAIFILNKTNDKSKTYTYNPQGVYDLEKPRKKKEHDGIKYSCYGGGKG